MALVNVTLGDYRQEAQRNTSVARVWILPWHAGTWHTGDIVEMDPEARFVELDNC